MKPALTPRQARFADEYLIDLNGTAAAIRAGYASGSAHVQASRLLSNGKVATAIDSAKAKRSEETKIDAEFILRGAYEVFQRCMQNVRPATDARGRSLKDADGNVLYRFDAAGANAALALLGRHVQVAAFEERIHVTEDSEIVARLQAGRDRVAKRQIIDGATHEALDADGKAADLLPSEVAPKLVS